MDRLDPDRYRCLTPELDRSPIATFEAHGVPDLEARLRGAGVVVSLIGNGRIRVSPAVYNTADDIERLAEALSG